MLPLAQRVSQIFSLLTIQAKSLGGKYLIKRSLWSGLNKPTLNDGVADYSTRREVIRRHGGSVARKVWRRQDES